MSEKPAIRRVMTIGQAACAAIAEELAGIVRRYAPHEYGFALVIVDKRTGDLSYASDLGRDDSRKVLREAADAIARIEGVPS